VNHGCAGDEPETLAHRLPTSLMTLELPIAYRSMCASVGGGA